MRLEDEVAELRRLVRHLMDREEIRDCIQRDARGRDRHDVEMVDSAYWPDGFIEAGGRVTPATEYAERQNAGHAGGFSLTAHNLTNHACEIAGDVAYCETYVIGALLSKDETTCKYAAGRYIDQLERRNGEWRIVLRRNVIDAVAEGDSAWLKMLSGFLKGQWSKDDPAYQRPNRLEPDDLRWP